MLETFDVDDSSKCPMWVVVFDVWYATGSMITSELYCVKVWELSSYTACEPNPLLVS
jgi:hypothetical protein